ncbi:FAST kinase domain-containing protein 5, mitochondrial-like isoform X1 [Eublepharis macularius]|uniref:FAST kinase domain-containing protein 5, mitochondrial-like isoform X1 n=1 Tax=Eublepharis macularius TaxID=481883 RepID=A0AA97L8X4_EUBMA|nr:FAST kinase domain-containing protein 5, mitochondrial-like isoform X1 [Eublepharis macularius]
MPTRIICRRFAGRSCSAAAFSTTTKVPGKRMFFGKAEEDQSFQKAEKSSKPVVTLRLWTPSEYRVSFHPSAYAGAKYVSDKEVSCSSDDGLIEDDYRRIGAKQVQNTYSITCSRRLSSTKNTLLDLESIKSLSTQASLTPSIRQDLAEDGGRAADVEAYDTKEDPRAFQKERPEYESLSYNRAKLLQPLSIEESSQILQDVAVFKSSLKPQTIAGNFFRLSSLPAEQHASLKSNNRFTMLCRYAVENIRLFDISELLTVLNAFVRLAILPTHSMLKVYESECCRRAWDVGLDQLLLVADLWRCLGRGVPQYLEIMLSYVSLHWQDLSIPQLVQLVYIIGEGRKAPEDLMKNLDNLVLKYLNSLSLEEVGAICLGFFKSSHGLSEHTMRKIGDKVSVHMAEMSNYALVNVLKMFRYTHVDHPAFLKQLGTVVPPRLPTIGAQGVMHITLACSALHYLDERIMNAVAYSMPSRATYCRSKDVAKFLWSFGCLNYEPPNAEEFYACLEEQLRTKMHEFQKFPEHFLTSLLALAFAKRFPKDLIDRALGPKFIKLISGCKFDLHKDLFTLDGTVEIECPDYKGNRLALQLKQEVTEMLWNVAKKETYLRPEVTEALSLLEDMLGGPQYVKSHMILPHTRSIDLEIRLDPNQKPLPFHSEAAAVTSELKESGVSLTDDLMNRLLKGSSGNQSPVDDAGSKEETCIQKRPIQQGRSLSTWDHFAFSDGVPLTGAILKALTKPKTSCEVPDPPASGQHLAGTKLAVQVSNRNHYGYDSKHLLGLHNLKRRQLRQIGYTVVEMPFWEWFPLLRRSRSEKLSYLHHKVFNSVL